MKKIELYTGEKTYMFPNGEVANKAAVLAHFPAALSFKHIVETDEAGEVMFALQNLSAMKSFHGLNVGLSTEDAIKAIEAAVNTDPPVDTTPSAEERIASALEYQILSTLPDAQ